ncbi:MAG: MmgE/PrpD family protein [Burkholderiales bacterium]|nr:MmgE/PrpD family protein [Burkholderiales bacterium]
MPDSAGAPPDLATFVRELRYETLPADVVACARRCLLDLVGTAAAGSRLPAARLAAGHAVEHMGGRAREASLLFDGRRASPAGAAFAGAAAIDALDSHDGHVLTKGHAGVAVLPALLAYLDGLHCASREFLTCIVMGYELATRAGIALHASVADYHCSGAWNALACAALGARVLPLTDAQARHALGIAEYWGPRGQILRVCETPSMVKDGSSWGAYAGVTAALMAASGFTGAPAITVEREAVHWNDLGTRFRIREQYFKAYPVCRWAQPAIEAALALSREHGFGADDIATVAIESFREAIDLGSRCRYPAATDEAQYSLTFPVACALVAGRVGADEVNTTGVLDPRVRRLIDATTLVEAGEFSRRFPAERWARVRVVLRDGRGFESAPAQARGGPENPFSDDEIAQKYHALAGPVLGTARAARIEALVAALTTDDAACDALRDELARPPP